MSKIMLGLKHMVSPFKKLTSAERGWSIAGLIAVILLFWTFSGHSYLPTPLEILSAFPDLFSDKVDVVWHFQKSLIFCFTCMAYAVVIGLLVAYLSVIPIFCTLCEFLRKFRFLPSTGMSFFFMKVTDSQADQMEAMMIFGIATWLIDSMVGIALSIGDDEVMYARTLRLNRWQTMKEVLIFGKAADMMKAVVSNFAIAWLLLASIENIAKASGGIGVILAEQNKYFHMEVVYAIQIMILLTGIAIDWSLRKLIGWFLPYTCLKQ